MALLLVTPTELDRVGTEITTTNYITAEGANVTNQFDTVFVYLKNTDVASIVVTIELPNQVDGEAIADKTVTLTASQMILLGPFPAKNYNKTGGVINFTAATADKIDIQAFYVT